MENEPGLKTKVHRLGHVLSFTTSTGTLFMFDLGRNELLVIGRSGSEIVLNAADLKELASQFDNPRFARLLKYLDEGPVRAPTL